MTKRTNQPNNNICQYSKYTSNFPQKNKKIMKKQDTTTRIPKKQELEHMYKYKLQKREENLESYYQDSLREK